MRVLFLSPRDSWPPTSGARLRDLHFARALAKQSELTYIFFGASANEMRAHLHGAVSVISVPPPPKYTAGKIFKGVVGKYPLPVENYSSPEMGAAINSALSAGRFDIVHLDSIHLCSHIPLIRNLASQAAVVLDWHNIESELMSRYAANTRSALRGTYARYTAGRLQKLEGEMLGDCSGHIVCSEREKSLLIAKKSSTRVVVVENGVDTEHFQPSGARGQHLLFVGQMSYHANADAAVSFVRSIWPEIRRTHPDITLQIVGSDPVPSVKELHGQDGVVVTGTVPDVLPYYQGAFASIVPLHTGGGTRLKILEAMSAGTPVISTAVGAEGLRVRDGIEFLLADASPSSWTTALAKLSDETVRAALVQRARDLVRREYDWRIVGARLAECYAAWSGSSSRKSSIQ